MSYCEECGMKIKEESFICSNCGKEIAGIKFFSVASEQLMLRENELQRRVKKFDIVDKVFEGIGTVVWLYLWLIQGYRLLNIMLFLLIVGIILWPFYYLFIGRKEKAAKREYQEFMDKKNMMQVLKESKEN